MTLWVADRSDAQLYAYTLVGGSRQASKEIALAADNTGPYGVWSDDTTLWVSDDGFPRADKVFAYTLAGARDDSKDIVFPMNEYGIVLNGSPRGLWSDGRTLWVANDTRGVSQLYAYNLDTARAGCIQGHCSGRRQHGPIRAMGGRDDAVGSGLF